MTQRILLTTILLLLSGCNLAFAPTISETATPPPTRTLSFATDTDAGEVTNVPNAEANSTTVPAASTSDDTPAAELCVQQTDWYEYTIRPGDNLTIIANLTRSTVAELIAANCLDNANQIRRGDTIYVPNEPE